MRSFEFLYAYMPLVHTDYSETTFDERALPKMLMRCLGKRPQDLSLFCTLVWVNNFGDLEVHGQVFTEELKNVAQVSVPLYDAILRW